MLPCSRVMESTRSTVTTTWNLWRKRTLIQFRFYHLMPSTSPPGTNHHARNHLRGVSDRLHPPNHPCQNQRAIMIRFRIRTQIQIDRTNWDLLHHHHGRIRNNTRKWWRKATSNRSASLPSTDQIYTRTSHKDRVFRWMANDHRT